MAFINLKATIGTVNYTDWLHVTATKVPTGSPVVWEDWIDVPVTSWNFIIPNLDPEIYIIRYYDAPTNASLGTLVAELQVDARTNQIIFEKRFYTCGGSNPGDPADNTASITDPYLIGKTVTGTFKEGFRDLEPITETTFDYTIGKIDVLTGVTFSTGEKFIVEVMYNGGYVTGGSGSGSLYSGEIDVAPATYTMLAADKNKRVRLVCTGTKQAVTLCSLSSISIGDGYYFDHSHEGVPAGVKLLLSGGDRIRYNGFNLTLNEFAEFWVNKGEHLKIVKQNSFYWEVITDYRGVHVGEQVDLNYSLHPGILLDDGALYDGDEHPRIYWWIKNILPATHKISDAVVALADNVYLETIVPLGKQGMFGIDPTVGSKKFRMPYCVSMMKKALADFSTFGTDTANRPIDYPGGLQPEMVGTHFHDDPVSTQLTGIDAKFKRGTLHKVISWDADPGATDYTSSTADNDGTQNRVDNIGVIMGHRE